MSLTMIKDGLDVDVAARRATGSFLFDTLADLPSRGASATWVKVGDDDVGTQWYVDDLVLEIGIFNLVRITARQAGYDWTWVAPGGDPLPPIVQRNGYRLWTTNKTVEGVLLLGYWHVFSNWTDEDSFGFGEPDPIRDSLKTWEIEFVDDSEHEDWYRKKNGAWPTGLVPPRTGTGVYWCRKLDIEVERYVDPVTGVAADYYRHFATFWEAPSLGATQLTWLFDSW